MNKKFFSVLLFLAGLSGVPANAELRVIVNGRALTRMEAVMLQTLYGAIPAPGRYWYDPVSGLYGVEGRGASGFVRANHAFAPLQADASGGDTNIFLNGRQLNLAEATFWRAVLGEGFGQGRWWLSGTGLVGVEGNRTPLANVAPTIAAIVQQTQSAGASGDHFWSSRGGAAGNSNYINLGDGQFASWDQ